MPKKAVIEDDSESSPEPVVKKTTVKAKGGKATEAPKKGKPTKQESSEEESESEQIVKKRKLTGDKIAVTKAPVKASKKQESDQESDAEIVQPKKTQAKKVPAKKAESSESESEEVPPVKGKKAPVQPVKGKQSKVTKQSDSESESDEQEAKPTKGAKKTSPKASPKLAAQKKPVKKQQSSESEDESEQQQPKKKTATKKSPKVTPKSSPKVAPINPKGKQAKKSVDLNEEESEQENPRARKVSKDSTSKKGKGKKVEQERGEFEIYVNGLSWTAGEKQLEDLFAPYGEIIETRLLRKEDGKSRGIAFVKFAFQSSRANSLELNETQQFGRTIGVQQSKGKQADSTGARGNNQGGRLPSTQDFSKPIPENIESTTIFVGNLSYNTTPQSLRAYFGQIGTVVDSRIATEKETGRKRGFGYVEFDSIDSVKKAFSLRGTDLDGRLINIDVATPKTNNGGSGGFRGGPRQGGFGGGFNSNNNRSTTVNLSRDDQAAKKGAISQFKGKRIAL